MNAKLDEIKKEFVDYYVNSMLLDDIIDLAKTYIFESVEELQEDEFKRHLFDNVDEHIYDDLKEYVEEDDPKKASQLWRKKLLISLCDSQKKDGNE